MTINLKELRRVASEATKIEHPFFVNYAVDKNGIVYSLNKWRGTDVRILVQIPNSHGYLRVSFCKDKKIKTFFVHKLVANVFLGKKPTRHHEVCHKNGIKTDNRLENLYWGTRKENAADRERHGNTARGDRNGWSKAFKAKTHRRLQPKDSASASKPAR